MSASINYLCTRANFRQVSENIPITKHRNPEKMDPPEVFEGTCYCVQWAMWMCGSKFYVANKKELVTDLITKAKQIEFLIESLPVPETEEEQVWLLFYYVAWECSWVLTQATRLQQLEDEMTIANEEYIAALDRASAYNFWCWMWFLHDLPSRKPVWSNIRTSSNDVGHLGLYSSYYFRRVTVFQCTFFRQNLRS